MPFATITQAGRKHPSIEHLYRSLKSFEFMRNLFCLILLLFSFSLGVHGTERKDVLQKCDRFFGKPIDEKPFILYEINSLFVLSTEFNKSDELTVLNILPKYYFEEQHPEWKEPDQRPKLSSIEYEDILQKLETIKPRGALVSVSPAGVILNDTVWHFSYYENSYWDRGSNTVWNEAGNEGIGYTVRSLTVSFMSTVKGRVIEKTPPGIKKTISTEPFGPITFETGPVHKVTIEAGKDDKNDKKYYVTKETFDSLKIKKRQTFRGVLVN